MIYVIYSVDISYYIPASAPAQDHRNLDHRTPCSPLEPSSTPKDLDKL